MANIGDKVIVRSNEDEPIRIGTLVEVKQHGCFIMVVEIDGRQYHCLGIVMPYSEELERFLNSMPPKRQWKLLVQLRNWEDNLAQLATPLR